MNIGIIGAGSVAQTIGKAWALSGQNVMLSSRNPAKVPNNELKVGSVKEAAQFGDIVFIAVNYWTLSEAIRTIGPLVEGKLVIDATNPLEFDGQGATRRVISDNDISGELLQAELPKARVAKAFTTLWMGHIENHAFATNRIAMPLAADRADDRALVAELVEQVGLSPLDIGTLAQSRPLDPPSPIWNVVLSPEEAAARVAAFRSDLNK